MKYIEMLEQLIKNNKWVRNDIGMGRVQHVKLIMVKERPMLCIISNTMEKPLYTRVEKMIVMNGQIEVFYDGEEYEVLNKEDYDKFNQYLSNSEWNILFEKDSSDKIERNNLVSDTKNFYAEQHINMESIMENGYDEKESEKVNKYFNLV